MNFEEENEVSLEKNEADYELLGVTWGMYQKKSFVFHVKQKGQYFQKI